MKTDANFMESLALALAAREKYVETQVVTNLRHELLQVEASAKTLLSYLQEKGLLKSDPYHTAANTHPLAVPPDDALTGHERVFELTSRLEKYVDILRYLGVEYPFAVSQMSHKELSAIHKAITFIDWDHLSENSTHPTAAALSAAIFTARKTANDVSSGVINDAISTVAKSLQEAITNVEVIGALRHEYVKAAIRNRIMPDIQDVATVEQFIAAVREKWTAVLPDEPVSQKMLMEIWTENDPTRGPGAQEALLAALAVEEVEERPSKSARPARDHLIDGIRSIATGGSALEKMVGKLTESSKYVGRTRRSLGALIRQLVATIFKKNTEQEKPFVITLRDSDRGVSRTEEILLTSFTENIMKKVGTYTGILARSGNMWQRISRASEGELLEYLRGELDDVSIIIQRSQGLDANFRKHAAPAMRSRLRGINMEVTLLQDQLSRGSRKITDYETAIAEAVTPE